MAETPDPTPMGPDDVASFDEWGHVGYDLALETEAYQALLEAHRAEPDNDELYADMKKAEAVMETTWLRMKPTT
jgi:hypothetical protein